MDRRNFLVGTASVLVFSRYLLARQAEYKCDVAVIGAGVGGFAAALSALQSGMNVIMTEETDWIGGQLTSQAVPPDEHPWIENFGCSRSYRSYRNAVRDYYRQHYPLTATASAQKNLNPGNGQVSKLTHEPRVSLAVLQAMLAPYVASGKLKILLKHVPVSAELSHDRVAAVDVRDLETGSTHTITAAYFLDSTELGDLLPLTKTEFVTGAEAQAETGELHAVSVAQPQNNQSFTYCFVFDHLDGEDHLIERPREYGEWRDYVPQLVPAWPGKFLSWVVPEPKNLEVKYKFLQPNPDAEHDKWGNLWCYRRIVDRTNFRPGTYRSDVTVANWPQNDYCEGDLLSATPSEKEVLLEHARQLSLSLFYWMQTEAPRIDGGYGYKGLRLRPDMTGTADGLAKSPYVRESRRIKAEFTVLEEHVGTEMRAKITGKTQREARAAKFPDTVGIGAYRIDLHPSSQGNNYIDISALAFQIPLGALTPIRTENLIAACKNIGTTHVTNGCYREHVTEWGIGEAAGALAAFAIRRKKVAREVRQKPVLLADFQRELRHRGVELDWPAEVHSVEWD